jgi:hypothetical protein
MYLDWLYFGMSKYWSNSQKCLRQQESNRHVLVGAAKPPFGHRSSGKMVRAPAGGLPRDCLSSVSRQQNLLCSFVPWY